VMYAALKASGKELVDRDLHVERCGQVAWSTRQH